MSVELTDAVLQRMNLPARYWSVKFSLVPASAPYREAVRSYLAQVRQMRAHGVGLVLWSPSNGTGKTSLAALVAKQMRRAGLTAYFTRTDSLQEDMIEGRRYNEETTVRERVREVDLLVLDDFGKEHKARSGFTENWIESLLRDRVQALRPTVLTTNLAPEQIKGVFSLDLANVMKEAFLTVQVPGEEGGGKNWRDEKRRALKDDYGVSA